jgi:hypothetical protein
MAGKFFSLTILLFFYLPIYAQVNSSSPLFVMFPMDQGFGGAKYRIFLKDKPDSNFNSYQYFDAKAIERRLRQNIPLSHYTDWPVSENYINQISAIADSIGKVSRWFNLLIVYATTAQIEEINKLPFVNKIEATNEYEVNVASLYEEENDTSGKFKISLNNNEKDLLTRQTLRMGAIHFQMKGIDGSGIRIAVFDVGFPAVDAHPVFEHLRKNGKIIKTYDFVKEQENVYHSAPHGTEVLSCIAGMLEDKIMGLATGAEFVLARTERMSMEVFSEEENWLLAAEWADKNGADIINSSLGYTNNRYFKDQMNGHSAFVTKAANIAASKGILVVNAAGNEGDSKWHIIAAPADADSVLSVGGVNPYSDYHVSFSSYGPTSDKRRKPNVCAMGIVMAATPKGLDQVEGTSFASPLTAGFAACAWQLNPALSNMELFNKIEQSANLYPYFDYAHGYGIPQANFFTNSSSELSDPTFEFIREDNVLKVKLKENSMRDNLYHRNSYTGQYYYNEQSDLDVKQGADNYRMYYHIQGTDGILKSYYIVNVEKTEVLSLNLNALVRGEKIMVHYKKFTDTYEVK